MSVKRRWQRYFTILYVEKKGIFTQIYNGPKSKGLIQRDSLKKINQRNMVWDLAIFAQNWYKIALRKIVDLWVIAEPTCCAGGGSPAFAVGVSAMWQVTGETRQVTPDIWHAAHDTWHMTFFCIGATIRTWWEIMCFPHAGLQRNYSEHFKVVVEVKILLFWNQMGAHIHISSSSSFTVVSLALLPWSTEQYSTVHGRWLTD